MNLTVHPNVTEIGYSSSSYLKENDIDINFSSLIWAILSFSVKTVNFKAAGPISPPDCYRFDIKVRVIVFNACFFVLNFKFHNLNYTKYALYLIAKQLNK